MAKLSFIESEVRKRLGRVPERELEALQPALLKLCEEHWAEIRGPEPVGGLARVLWAVTPHVADLFVDLYGDADSRLFAVTNQLPPVKVLACLALAEIQRGDAEGARLAYESMMVFDSPQATEVHTQAVRSRLRGGVAKRGRWHKHVHQDPLFKAVAMICDQTARYDFDAIAAAIDYLAAVQTAPVAAESDPVTAPILEFLREEGLVIQGVDEGRICYTLRGMAKKPVSHKVLEDILEQIRGGL